MAAKDGLSPFVCPHCGERSHVKWTNWVRDMPKDRDGLYGSQYTTCQVCGRVTISIIHIIPSEGEDEARIVIIPARPRSAMRPVPAEVPDEYATEFREACLVLPDSQRASAALSRRCLQNLLMNVAGATGKDLDKLVQDVIDRRVFRADLADDLDAVRVIGNFAAHPMRMKITNPGMIVPVEPEEAEWLLDVIEQLFVALFVEPAVAKARRDALSQKLADAGKQPLKQTPRSDSA